MARVLDSVGKHAELQRQALEVGKRMALAAFGPDGPGLDVDLSAIEDLAAELSEAVMAGVCEESARQQARRIGSVQPCPVCGRECAVEMPDDTREIQTRHGTFSWQEPHCHCPSCRRDFFPSTHCTED